MLKIQKKNFKCYRKSSFDNLKKKNKLINKNISDKIEVKFKTKMLELNYL